MRHTWQKHLAGLLAVIMLCSLLPLPVSAAAAATGPTDPKVTLQKADNTGNQTTIADDTPGNVTFAHNEVWNLNVSANFAGVNDGEIKITVAPGLKIDTHQNIETLNFVTDVSTGTTGMDVPDLTDYTPPLATIIW